ncbi:MAG: nuclease, partial [Pseudomonadota bacterium]
MTEFTDVEISGFATTANAALLDEGHYVLELLHLADQEANTASIPNIPALSAMATILREEDLGDDGIEDNTLFLSSGDAIIPGVFFDASAEVFGSEGIADIQIQNELGVQAIALGNHEFDLGTEVLAGLIDGSAEGDFSALSGTDLDGLDFEGASFPYLSANLDFSTDPDLAPLEAEGGQPLDEALANTVTSSTVADVNGEAIAIIGATVPTIGSISSPGDDLGIFPEDFDSTPTDAQLDALAAIIQAEVDAVLAANEGLDKVILLSHMQQITIEQALAERLEGVDIIVAGGSNTRLFDDEDRARAGDSVQGEYPGFFTGADGAPVAVVNTDGNYKYLGRLVVEFDENGEIIPESYDEDVSGAYATDAGGLIELADGFG